MKIHPVGMLRGNRFKVVSNRKHIYQTDTHIGCTKRILTRAKSYLIHLPKEDKDFQTILEFREHSK